MARALRALGTLCVLAACERAPAPPSPAASATPAAAPVSKPTLAAAHRAVGGRKYLELTGGRLALALERPSQTDARVLAVVPGTYTSPQGDVEGAVVLDGRVVRADALAWEALLVIQNGAPVVRWERKAPSRELLAELAARKASLLQGHLLVGDGKPRPLKPSPALGRRALVTRAGGAFAIVESTSPVELARFADDLVRLGATYAMNLDMGGWSEGWYRRTNGTIARLGDDFRATERQTNWLVLRAP
jgi:hypothetical protein